MTQKLKGIVLCTLKYSDKSNIVRIYTDQGGQQSFLVPANHSRKSKVNRVLFQPLSLLELEADVRPTSEIHSIREARLFHPLVSIPFNPYKSGIAMFLAEFLYRALREEEPDGHLFAYVSNSILWLDTCTSSFANFHLVFLMHLSLFVGLRPNTDDYSDGDYFDMLNACFVSVRPSHVMYLQPDESSKICTLLRMNYDNMHLFLMSRTDRNRCLDILCQYYSIHLPGFPELKSLSVLKELYS